MSISLKLLDSDSDIEKKVNAALSKQLNQILLTSQNKILNSVSSLIPSWINKQPEIQALLSGELIGQFGITYSPSSIVSSIISAVVNSTSIKFRKYNERLVGGGLEISIQPDDFNNLLALSIGHTIYKEISSSGDLHWLQWMLLRGNEIIVVGYQYNPRTGLGRTGLGNMISGAGFRVPPQYSGTKENNFITRSLIGPEQEKDISSIFKNILGA